MSRFLALSSRSLVLVAALGFASCGGGSGHQALAKESVGLMEELADSLTRITDKASAEAHAGELEELVARMKDVQARVEAKGELSEDEGAELAKRFDADMSTGVQKMTQEMTRISADPEVMGVIGPILEKLGE